MKTITCIIPAYNEQEGIEPIIKVLLPFLGESIFEILVIDDCSTDTTKEIVKKYPDIVLLSNKKNLGKSKSVAIAIEQAKGNYIFLLDADLQGVTSENITSLLSPIYNNTTDVSITLLQNSWPLFPFKKIDYCSGQRVLEKRYFLEILEKIKNAKGYELEVLTNKLIIEKQLKLHVAQWENVTNRYHHNEVGIINGRKKNFKIWKDILSGAGGIIAIYVMNIQLQKLLVPNNNDVH